MDVAEVLEGRTAGRRRVCCSISGVHYVGSKGVCVFVRSETVRIGLAPPPGATNGPVLWFFARRCLKEDPSAEPIVAGPSGSVSSCRRSLFLAQVRRAGVQTFGRGGRMSHGGTAQQGGLGSQRRPAQLSRRPCQAPKRMCSRITRACGLSRPSLRQALAFTRHPYLRLSAATLPLWHQLLREAQAQHPLAAQQVRVRVRNALAVACRRSRVHCQLPCCPHGMRHTHCAARS